MTSSAGLDQVAARLTQVGALFTGAALVDVATRVGRDAKRTQLDQARRDTGGDLRLSRWGRRANRGRRSVSVRYTVSAGGERVEVAGSPPALWALLEGGAQAHAVGRARRGRPPRLLVAGQWLTGPVSHPGSRARRTWSSGADVVRREAPATVHRAVQQRLGQAFRG